MPKGHAIIDGSNLATEGRKEPSLAQLDEAVRTIHAEFDFEQVVVIVDATFEHRVATSETKAARAAVDDGDIITPPAGVIGRGDAFILQVADRAGAVVFSNDSFQEFHGDYDWLFEEGRLVGGKPIPGVGWIYVARSPVRGPVSRRATADSRKAAKKKSTTRSSARTTNDEETKAPEPSTRRRPRARKTQEPKPQPAARAAKASTTRPRRSRSSAPTTKQDDGSNDSARWKSFKADYPVGSTIAATVDRFSSHGAYGSVDDIVIYLPNRLLGRPAPNKARDVVDLGDTMDFVIHRYDSERNGIDAGLIAVDGATDDGPTPSGRSSRRSPAKKTPAKKATARKPTARKATAKKAPARTTTAKKAPAKKAPASRTTAKKTAVTKTAAKKRAAKKPAKKTTAKTSANKATAKTTANKAAPAKRAAKKTAARKAVATPTKKAARRR